MENHPTKSMNLKTIPIPEPDLKSKILSAWKSNPKQTDREHLKVDPPIKKNALSQNTKPEKLRLISNDVPQILEYFP